VRVIVTGGTGYVGRHLVSALRARGDSVAILSRSPGPSEEGVDRVAWSGRSDGEWTRVLEDADAVVNLAGASIAGRRWTKSWQTEIRRSRVEATRSIVDALARASAGPRVLVSGSAMGYYGATGDEPLDESAPAGTDFLAQVCVDWESAARAARSGVRVVLLRTGLVLGKGPGGPLEQMALPFKLFVGGPVADGRQWMSWIHVADEVGLILHALDRDVTGPLNAVAPGAVTNRDFGKTLAKVLGRPFWAPVPKLVLRVALGKVAHMIVTGQRLTPRLAIDTGYHFRFPELEPALRDIYGRV
jgi:hypothetical protein